MLRRWIQLFTGPLLVQRYLTTAREEMSDSDRLRVVAWAETPEQSGYISVKRRVQGLGCGVAEPAAPGVGLAKKAGVKKADKPCFEDTLRSEAELRQLPKAPLLPFDPTETRPTSIPFAFDDYLELVDTLGRSLHPAKRGSVPEKTPAILIRLGIDAQTFIDHADRFLQEFGSAVGTPANLMARAATRQNRYLRGMSTARAVFAGKNCGASA